MTFWLFIKLLVFIADFRKLWYNFHMERLSLQQLLKVTSWTTTWSRSVGNIYLSVRKDFWSSSVTTFGYETCYPAKLVRKQAELMLPVNALMHQDMMDRIKPLLDFLEEIKDRYHGKEIAGVFTWSTDIPLRPSTMLQPWWASEPSRLALESKAGAWGCLGIEIHLLSSSRCQRFLEIPAEVLVYGASVIHHSASAACPKLL